MTRLVSPREWRAQPWQNGGGTTHEILRWPDERDERAYDVRASLAEVAQAGPFSRFPGYRRWSFLADDAPIALVTPSGTHELLALGDHIELPGDVPLAAVLRAGATHLFNVLAREGLPIAVGHGATAHAVLAVFALAATPALARWHALVLDPPAPAATAADTVWIAER